MKLCKHLIFSILLALFVAGLSGCGSSSGNDEFISPPGGDDGTTVVPEIIKTVTVAAGTEKLVADGDSTTTVTATVANADGDNYSKSTTVTFTTTSGTLSETEVTTNNGLAAVELTSSNSLGPVTIKATAEGVQGKVVIEFVPAPRSLSLALSQTTVKSDNSDSAILTATVLNSNFAPYEGLPVTFSVNGGWISAASKVTDEQGMASITFKSGTAEKANRVVTITVSVDGLDPKIIPIQIVGTTISLSNEKTNLDVSGDDMSTMIITVLDAGSVPIYNAEVDMAVDPAGALSWSTDGSMVTDVSGKLEVNIRGARSAEYAVLTVKSRGATATQEFSVSSAENRFAIIEPEDDPYAAPTGAYTNILVRSPSGAPVQFSTTFGAWGNGETVQTVNAVNNVATGRITSNEAGIANIQVFDTSDPEHKASDSMVIAFSAPSSDSAKLLLKSSSTIVSPSSGDIKNQVNLTATVKNDSDQVVGGAPVAFSMTNTTGGGETLSPVLVYTDSSGVAKSTFTSGSLSSSAKGVIITARVVGKNISSELSIVIGGEAGSVIIGRSSKVAATTNDTAYELPMSVLVSDANGNPVEGAKVNLGTWAERYNTGFWVSCSGGCCIYISDTYKNEDINENMVLDAGEDLDGDGEITPPNSAAGNVVPKEVETNEDGIAEFKLVYLKSSAGWIEDRITASTLVSGSEAQSSYTLWLPWMAGEECSLPDSPYNTTEEKPPPTIDTLKLSANPDEVAAGGFESTISVALQDCSVSTSGDTTTSECTTVEDADNEVTFSTTAGEVTPAKVKAVNGVATATFTSPKYVGSGEAVISASSSGISGEPVTISIVPDVPAPEWSFIKPEKPNLTANGESTSTITANVYDKNGNPVKDGEVIVFDVVNGNISYRLATTKDGKASVTYTAPLAPDPFPSNYAAGISATMNDGVAFLDENITDIDLIQAHIESVNVTPGANSIPANGTSYTNIRASVNAVGGGRVQDGTAVTFETTAGTFEGGSSSFTAQTVNGIATATLTSSIVTGQATVKATSGGVIGTATVAFVAGSPAEIQITPTPSSLTADGVQQSNIDILVLDSNGNPVQDGEKLTLYTDSLSGGNLSQLQTTTSGGRATVTYTVGTSSEDVTITARATNGVTGEAVITLDGPEVIAIDLTPTPDNLPADGSSESEIQAELSFEGNPTVPVQQDIIFSIISGGGWLLDQNNQRVSSLTVTSSGGSATVNLQSGTTAGEAVIQAKAGNIIEETTIVYTAGKVEISIIPNAVLGRGNSTAKVTAMLTNLNGQPAAQPQNVDFILSDQSMGSLSANSMAIDAEGKATVTFTDSSKGGTVTVIATWVENGVQGQGEITIHPPPTFINVMEGYPNPTPINIKGTGGMSTSQIFFEVKDSLGEPVVDGYRIDFSIVTGPNGGENIWPTYAYTKDGKVGTVLRSGYKSGPVSIKAVYADDTNVSIISSQIAIVAGQPVGEAFGISAAYLNVSGLRTFGVKDSITINADDIYGNAIPDNTAISFKTYNTGGMADPGSSNSTGGFATSNLITTANPIPIQGMVSVTAEAINGGRTTHVTCIEVTQSNQNVIYLGTDGGGVYKSLNYGVDWRNISRSSTIAGQNWLNPYINDIAIDPDNPNTVYSASGYLGSGNVYRSLDGGLNWNGNDPEKWMGVYSGPSAVLSILCDDDGGDTGTNDRYIWIGTAGDGVFWAPDGETLTQSATLAGGSYVSDIVKLSGTHGATAILYAGTASGVYRSINGGATWSEAGVFVGDYINKLAIDETNNVIYAGSEDSGVWWWRHGVSTSWLEIPGMGKTLESAVPEADINNVGNGVMSVVDVNPTAKSEDWRVVAVEDLSRPEGYSFQVSGSVSGIQGNAYADTPFTSNNNYVSFTITGGNIEFVIGDKFTFSTTRDPGSTLKDLLVVNDGTLPVLYAITYFFGTKQPHAIGNVYALRLQNSGGPAAGEKWEEINTGLPLYDPPDDLSLLAQHAISKGINSSGENTLFIGGEGISLNRTSGSHVTNGDPAGFNWVTSQSGLTNLIMARMPILFSGTPTMHGDPAEPGYMGSYNVVEVADEDGTPGGDGQLDVGDQYRFTVFIEDVNGNPPIAGSRLLVQHEFLTPLVVLNYEYGDGYTGPGTWRDPADPSTRNPFEFETDYKGVTISITFTPYCDTGGDAPGCSGNVIATSFQ